MKKGLDMSIKEYSGTWREIWNKKGEEEGGAEDALIYGGWNKTETPANDICSMLTGFMDIKSTDRVLEIGCGAGGMAQYLDCNYIGIDYSFGSVNKCMKFFGKTAICCDADDLPFKDNYFDKAFAYGCFMYFPDKDYVDRALCEMERVTRKMVFIGELPISSHEPKHLLFDREFFANRGYETVDGWAAPYQGVRFSAYKRLEVN